MDTDFEQYLKNARQRFCLVFRDYNSKEVDNFLIAYDQAVQKAINYSRCCTQLPSKEEVNIIAKQKAVKYAFTNEYSYWKYVEAIEEGFELAKSKLSKTK